MPGREATEALRNDTTHYQREGLNIIYQLLLPMCYTTLSGIWEGKRPLYYYEVKKWSNVYAYQIGLGGSYIHGFKHMKLPQIVCHDGCIVRGSVRGGISGTVYFFWYMGADYDDDITQGMNYSIVPIKNSKENSVTTT